MDKQGILGLFVVFQALASLEQLCSWIQVSINYHLLVKKSLILKESFNSELKPRTIRKQRACNRVVSCQQHMRGVKSTGHGAIVCPGQSWDYTAGSSRHGSQRESRAQHPEPGPSPWTRAPISPSPAKLSLLPLQGWNLGPWEDIMHCQN